jgi:hypothetical protein
MSTTTAQEQMHAGYLASLNDRELKAYYIAKDHLGLSFTMERSNGFRKWKKDQETIQPAVINNNQPQIFG